MTEIAQSNMKLHHIVNFLLEVGNSYQLGIGIGIYLGCKSILVPISPPVHFEAVENRNFAFLDWRFCEQHLSERAVL